jgi:hypothetical protein
MVIEWREREHEEINAEVGRDERAQKYLKHVAFVNFGLSKE